MIGFGCKIGEKMSFRQVQSAQIVTCYRDGLSKPKINAKYNVSKTAVCIASQLETEEKLE